MSRRVLALLLAVGMAIGLFVWWTSDGRRIRRRLARATELMEKEGPEPELGALAAMREVAEIFAPEFVAIAEPVGARITDRRELVGLLHSARSRWTSIEIDVANLEIDVRENETALSGFVARVTTSLDGRESREAYRMRVDWVEEEDRWSIHEAVLVEVIESSERGLLAPLTTFDEIRGPARSAPSGTGAVSHSGTYHGASARPPAGSDFGLRHAVQRGP